jgi:hypothetical protein
MWLLNLTCKIYALRQEIKNLDALVNLEELWLGKNKIEKLQVPPFSLSVLGNITNEFAPIRTSAH